MIPYQEKPNSETSSVFCATNQREALDKRPSVGYNTLEFARVLEW